MLEGMEEGWGGRGMEREGGRREEGTGASKEGGRG